MSGLRSCALLSFCAGVLAAQTTWTSVRISSDPPGRILTVDGVDYSQLTSFFWVVGSTHQLAMDPRKNSPSPDALYTFVGWIDSTGRQYGSATTITVTASSAVWSVVATFSAEYTLELSFFHCPYDIPAHCGQLPGTVSVNGIAYWKDAVLWLPSGTQVSVEAVANPGFVFAGWNNGFASPQSAVQTLVMSHGWRVMPTFVGARQVAIDSSPPGMKLVVDGSVIVAPWTFAWAGGSQHYLAPASPQQDQAGGYWLFDGWSNGAAEQQVFTVPSTSDPPPVTARFVRGFVAAVLTDPVGLKVKVDGSDAWLSPYFIWSVGSTHQLSAPLEQTDKGGRHYVFRGWTDGAADAVRSFSLTDTAAAEGVRLVARYELLGRLTVESVPPGVTLSVDGAECLSPCIIDRAAGARVTIAAPASAMVRPDTRLDFHGWQDQAPRQRVWTLTAQVEKLTAVYQTMYRLQGVSEPLGGAYVRFDPPAEDGFFVAGTPVLVTAEARPGYRFRRWGGDLEGIVATAGLVVSQPRSVIAQMDRAPYVAPAGVANAAGATPEPGVAPGSIIAIYGENLAPGEETGPASPLAQTLAGVTVQVIDRLLPLFFVSPRQINALLPSDLPPGDYRLTIRAAGQPDVSTSFQAVRNAPGLFANQIDSVPYAVASHLDGTPVLPSSPAFAGELVTILGTGFGPYIPSPPEGFLVPADAVFTLADPAQIEIGGIAITPQWVRAASGFAGVTAVRFQVPADLDTTSPPQLKVRVYTRESNTVYLPVVN